MQYLLDTCAVLWLAGEEPPLSDKTLENLENPEIQVFVSAISSAEIACLVAKGKVELPVHWRRWFRQAIDQNGWEVLSVDLENIEEAYALPGEFHADPADRILVSAARLHRMTLVTGDRKILDYPHVSAVS